jgi:DNA mismatch repair protein MutS2
VHLGDTFDLLIVTGPNTGGKTVSLKTVGLLTLMGQAGLHIPALDRSELSVFTEVYADIGDEQSIEQSLSTFSSHMTNIVSFIEKADRNSLVLFDELGAGTDPTEGAALAIAILSHLHRQGIRTMATTHYSELKIFALSTDKVENASCEFNIETLQPTYRLLIGVPGKSNAFAISSKLGLPSYIIEDAKGQISEQDESFEDVLTSLEQNRIAQENEQRALEYRRQQIERREKELQNREHNLEAQKNRIIEKANDQAHTVLQEAKEYADQVMKDFRKFGKAGVNSAEMERRRNELRKEMNKTAARTQVKPAERTGKKIRPQDLTLGTAVKVLSLNLNGTVSSKPDAKGNLFVRMGIIRSKINISDLEIIDEPDMTTTKKASHTGSGRIRMSKAMHVSNEINLLGKTVDEAVAELDKYLDDAVLAHLSSVRVIHGKGTGALRKGVHQYLKTQRRIADFHLAEYGEGDAGVTIVTFR